MMIASAGSSGWAWTILVLPSASLAPSFMLLSLATGTGQTFRFRAGAGAPPLALLGALPGFGRVGALPRPQRALPPPAAAQARRPTGRSAAICVLRPGSARARARATSQ